MGKSKTDYKSIILMGAMMIAVIGIAGYLGAFTMSITPTPDVNEDTPGQGLVECGKAATMHLNSFTGSWGSASSETEVYPVYSVYNDGIKIINDAESNSTTSVATCDKGTIYFTGSTYYGDKVNYEVKKETYTVPNMKAYAIVSTTDLVITAYDTEEDALTADDNATNTADYAGGSLGAGEVYNYYMKLKNNVADKTFRLGAILTYYCGAEIDDFELTENGWTETQIPSGDLDTGFALTDDTGESTTCYIRHAYVPDNKYVELSEWQDTGKLGFILDTDDSTGPSANGDSYCGAIFVDYACEQDKNGAVACGWYRSNDNADPDDIGVSEAVVTTGFKGLDVGCAIEPQ